MTGVEAHLLGVVLTIPGDPGGARINNARRATIVGSGATARPGTRPSARAKSWRSVAVLELRVQWAQVNRTPGIDVIGDRSIVGPVALEITTHWPKVRRKGPAAGLPLGDVDATAKAVLDALQGAGVLADDAQVVRLHCINAHDRERPRIVVRFLPERE